MTEREKINLIDEDELRKQEFIGLEKTLQKLKEIHYEDGIYIQLYLADTLSLSLPSLSFALS